MYINNYKLDKIEMDYGDEVSVYPRISARDSSDLHGTFEDIINLLDLTRF